MYPKKHITGQSFKLACFLVYLFSLCLVADAETLYTTPYTFTTLAGAESIGSTNGIGLVARFHNPRGVVADAAGNRYIADSGNHTIRKISPGGIVTTWVGRPGYPGSADGPAVTALFREPTGLAIDPAGNVYVADAGNSTIRKITPAGLVTTVAGSPGQTGVTDGQAAAALFNRPAGVAVDGAGNLYVADALNHTIRKITSAGLVSTLAGTAGHGGSADGRGAVAGFLMPSAVAVDQTGQVYVADSWNHLIRKIATDGTVSTLAGDTGNPGSADGVGPGALFKNPSGITLDANGTIFVADTGNFTIRRITPAGMVSTFAGFPGGNKDSIYGGGNDGTGATARFIRPTGIFADSQGNLLVGDTGNNTVRMITPTAVVSTLAGLSMDAAVGSADGAGTVARFFAPTALAVGKQGEIYVSDQVNHAIRKITGAGVVTTLAGATHKQGSADGPGSTATFYYPDGIAVDGSGNVYVSDTLNCTIRKITAGGTVTTLAGQAGITGSADGTGSAAQFMFPEGVAVDASGNVYVADTGNATIRKITPAGMVTTLAGTPNQEGTADGTGASARFHFPAGICLDGTGNLYVLDAANYTVRKITPAGVVTTYAGFPGQPGSNDGPKDAARFSQAPLPSDGGLTIYLTPTGIAADAQGNLYVADTANSVVRKITPGGTVSTLGGLVGAIGTNDGTGSEARFNQPWGIAVNADGMLYVSNLDAILRGSVAVIGVTINAQPQSQTVQAGSEVVFSVTATGAPTLQYQWYFNGTAIKDATGDTMKLPTVKAADAGDYHVVVSNITGSATSNKATLTVTVPAPAPAPGGGSGGGSPSHGFLIALLSLTSFRRYLRKLCNS